MYLLIENDTNISRFADIDALYDFVVKKKGDTLPTPNPEVTTLLKKALELLSGGAPVPAVKPVVVLTEAAGAGAPAPAAPAPAPATAPIMGTSLFDPMYHIIDLDSKESKSIDEPTFDELYQTLSSNMRNEKSLSNQDLETENLKIQFCCFCSFPISFVHHYDRHSCENSKYITEFMSTWFEKKKDEKKCLHSDDMNGRIYEYLSETNIGGNMLRIKNELFTLFKVFLKLGNRPIPKIANINKKYVEPFFDAVYSQLIQNNQTLKREYMNIYQVFIRLKSMAEKYKENSETNKNAYVSIAHTMPNIEDILIDTFYSIKNSSKERLQMKDIERWINIFTATELIPVSKGGIYASSLYSKLSEWIESFRIDFVIENVEESSSDFKTFSSWFTPLNCVIPFSLLNIQRTRRAKGNMYVGVNFKSSTEENEKEVVEEDA